MTADMEVICVGNELLIGKIQNTNAHWLSKQATQLGVNVKRVTVVQDIAKTPVHNHHGVRVDLEGTVLFALPGVPSEMEAIFTETIVPLLKQAVGNSVFCERSMFVDNMMESCLAPVIDKVMSDNEGVYIKSHPMGTENKPHMEIHLTITAKQEQKPKQKLLKAARQLSSLIKEIGGKATVEQ